MRGERIREVNASRASIKPEHSLIFQMGRDHQKQYVNRGASPSVCIL